MLNLREYRNRADRLADHLPWAALVAPGIVLNKDGSFQRTARFRGPDLESATEAELVSACARANNVLKRFGSGWALHFEAERREALGYPRSVFPEAASWLVDEERRASFEAVSAHFESVYHLTLTFLPPPDQAAQAGRALVERNDDVRGRDWRQALAAFAGETDRALDLFSGFMPSVHALDDAETLTFLHGAISPRRHKVAVPETPLYLDALLADTPFTGGLEPLLGDRHLRTLTILGFPNLSRPGILDALNHLDFGYRWVTRFIALDKMEATRALTKLRRQWFNKRKSISALLREVIYNQPAQLLDSDADNKVVDADLALQALGGDHVAFGYLTTTITVADIDRARVDEKIRGLERVVGGLGFTSIRESMNAVEAWLGSLPGHVYANVRQPLVHSLNLAHLMPLSSVWAGPPRNTHLDGPPLLYAETSGSTPFRLCTHVGDVGHMMIVGPTGAGKSVLLALIALQFRRYPQSQVYFFDKGFSARAAVLAMGGAHHALGLGGEDSEPGNGGEAIAFQPLRNIDGSVERAWAAEWIAALLAHEKVPVTPEVKEAVWSALTSLASAPAAERTLTGLALLLQSAALRSALSPYTLEGPFGRLLDAAEDGIAAIADIQCFETEALLGQAGVVAPVLTYLFHRLEERFTGRPTLLILDEESAEADRLDAEIDALVQRTEHEEMEAGERAEAETRIRSLGARLEEIMSKPPILDDAMKPQVGAFLILDEAGRPRLDASFYTELPAEGDDDGADVGAGRASDREASPAKAAGLSRRLVDELAMQRRDILAVHVAADPGLALDLAIFLMIDREAVHSFERSGSSLIAAAPSNPVLDFRPADAAATIVRAEASDALDRGWADGRTRAERFDLFRALGEEARIAWLGHAVARTLEASLNLPGERRCAFHDHLGRLLEIDVARWWRPTGANYFDRVPKAVALAALAEVGGGAFAARYARVKKAELTETCERVFAGDFVGEVEVKQAALAWVPETMRFAGPVEEAAVAPAEDDDVPPWEELPGAKSGGSESEERIDEAA